MANTGYLIQPRLKRVTDDTNEFPLDENDNLCSETGLPQATIENPTDSPNYRVLNTSTCPVSSAETVSLTVYGDYNIQSNRFEFIGSLSEALTDGLGVSFLYSFRDNGVETTDLIQGIFIESGNVSGATAQTYNASGAITDINITIQSVAPNPNGNKIITY